ncbi:hypothetical protein KY343_04055 [Candidatus Woesearchaeota archaeon]|nr:hypothetical protein [Candidatus Woesearchaeota archaeon]
MNQEEMQKQMQLQQQIQQLEFIVKQKLTKQALERFGNVKAAHPEKAIQLLAILGQAIQTGKIEDQIDDDQLKDILMRLTPEKKDFNIRRM